MENDALLELYSVSKQLSNAFSLKRISFKVYPGEVHAFIGSNASGKSALFSVIMGILSADSGEFCLNGRKILLNSIQDAQKNGLLMLDQHQKMFDNLTIYENIFFGHELMISKSVGLIDHKRMKQETKEIFEQMGVQINITALFSTLTGAQKQMVAIARAMVSQARIILMDEPTTQLNPQEKQILYRAIQQLKIQGKAFLMISHDLKEIIETADVVHIMEKGTLVKSLPSKEIDYSEIMRDIYGFSAESLYDRTRNYDGKELLRIAFPEGPEIQMQQGQLLALVDSNGSESGSLEIATALAGLSSLNAELYFHGEKITFTSPIGAINLGIAVALGPYYKEELHEAYLISQTGAKDDKASRAKLKSRMLRNDITRMLSSFVMRKNRTEFTSGGDASWMQIERAISRRAKLYILFNPSAGLDMPARMRLYHELGQLMQQGAGIIFLTTDLDEAFGFADQLALIKQGKIVQYGQSSELDRTKFEQEMKL